MKALLVCLAAVILETASCNDGTTSADCPPCPDCPTAGQIDSVSELKEMPEAQELIANFANPQTKYGGDHYIAIDVNDLQTMINMAKRDNRTKVYFFLGSMTDAAAREYATAHNVSFDEARFQPIVLPGTATMNERGGIDKKVYAVKTMICPPPNSCGMDVANR